MTKLLEEAVALLETLPEVEQDRVAQVLLAFTREANEYTLDAEQLAGIDHAMGQARSRRLCQRQADKGHLRSGAMRLRLTEDAASGLEGINMVRRPAPVAEAAPTQSEVYLKEIRDALVKGKA